MIAVATVFLVLTISLLVVRISTVGLTMTGLSKDLAQFQALSAFTNSGFTTKESEEIVNHPIRRRIIMHLMLLGNAGIVIGVTSVMLSFLNAPTGEERSSTIWVRICGLAIGVLVFWLMARSRHVERLMWFIDTWALKRWWHIDVHDYTRLLRLAHNYVVLEMQVNEDDWLAGQTLFELQLASEGILVLGIERSDGTYQGAPRGKSKVESGDCLILYGQQETLIDLDNRRADMIGNLHHVMAVTRQLDVLEDETREDELRKDGQSSDPAKD
jgi:hypothetical protein